jgi:hypothetical protein
MLETIETILARHQVFGDSDYINEQLRRCYKRRLGKISAYLPAGGELLSALDRAPDHNQYRVIGDTVVRCAIQHALKQLETGTEYGLPLDQCEEIIRATARHVEEGRPGAPLESGVTELHHLGPRSPHVWIWSEDHADDVFGRSFRYLVQDNYGESLCTLDSEELELLARGAQLLEDLLPTLSRSALSHTHLIAVFPMAGNWRGKASSSQFRISGTIFLSRELLRSPWQVAEYLFHESLHQKLYDFRHGHSLLVPGYWSKDTSRVCALWNTPDSSRSNYWDTHRAVVAFHVYVHLALLCTVAEQRALELEPVYGTPRRPFTMLESRRAFERARYLGEQIKERCWQELGFAGQQIVEWLLSVLDAFDPDPPPPGAYVHLLLDLYRRDADRVELILGELDATASAPGTATAALLGELIKLIREEVDGTRALLSAVRAEPVLRRLDNALAQYADEEMGMRFPQVRRLIAKILLELAPDGYRLDGSSPSSGDPEEVMKQMIHGSSQRLDAILTAYT